GRWLTREDLQSLPGICQRGADHGSAAFQRNASGRSSPKSASAYASTGGVSAGIGAGVAVGRAANGNVPCGRRMRMQGTILAPICVAVGESSVGWPGQESVSSPQISATLSQFTIFKGSAFFPRTK